MRGDQVLLLLPNDDERMSGLTKRPNPYPDDVATKYGTCSLSGLPARYRDPLTGLRYGSLEAFKHLRSEHASAAAQAPVPVAP